MSWLFIWTFYILPFYCCMFPIVCLQFNPVLSLLCAPLVFFTISACPHVFPLSSLVSSHSHKHTCRWIGYDKFPQGVNECVHDALWRTGLPSRVNFPPHSQHSRDKLKSTTVLTMDKVLTEDEWLNVIYLHYLPKFYLNMYTSHIISNQVVDVAVDISTSGATAAALASARTNAYSWKYPSP